MWKLQTGWNTATAATNENQEACRKSVALILQNVCYLPTDFQAIASPHDVATILIHQLSKVFERNISLFTRMGAVKSLKASGDKAIEPKIGYSH